MNGRAHVLTRGLAALLPLLAIPTPANAFPEFVGSRALGMGASGRADARGAEALLLNPSGMSLSRIYTLEGAYQFQNHDGGHLFHASVVDSTSSYNLAGGLFYSYRTVSPPGTPNFRGHEGGIALSHPFGEWVLLGVTGKYLNLSGGAPEPNGGSGQSGVTVDVGATVKIGSMLAIGVTGYNLRDLSTVRAPVAVGYGAALIPTPDLTIAIDGLHDFTTADPTRGVRTSVNGGAEYSFQQKLVLRAGGGRDGGTGSDYVTAGFAGISELGALDFGVRQDVSGALKMTFFAAGLRLFVPQP